MEVLLILLLAVAIDFTFGEPPHPIHPVVWMGKVIAFLERGGLRLSPLAQFFYGLSMVAVSVGVFAIPAYFLIAYVENFNSILYVIIGALLLKTTFSARELHRAALRVNKWLLEDKLDEARLELRALVGRDTSKLAKPHLASAAVESVAENTCDSFVAPLFYFLLFGVPGAMAYRMVNTLDAMIGHHGKYEYLGKAAARLDDILNYIPARLTALLLVVAAFVSRGNGRASWQLALCEHSRTESPNAGWSMAATAGAMNVQLEKIGFYSLGESYPLPAPEAINTSIRLTRIAMLSWAIIIAGVIGIVAAT